MATRPVALCEPPLAFERRDGRSLAAALVADARGGDALPLLQMTLVAPQRGGSGARRRRAALFRLSRHGRGGDRNRRRGVGGPRRRRARPTADLIAGLVRDVAADPLTGAPTPIIGALDRARIRGGAAGARSARSRPSSPSAC